MARAEYFLISFVHLKTKYGHNICSIYNPSDYLSLNMIQFTLFSASYVMQIKIRFLWESSVRVWDPVVWAVAKYPLLQWPHSSRAPSMLFLLRVCTFTVAGLTFTALWAHVRSANRMGPLCPSLQSVRPKSKKSLQSVHFCKVSAPNRQNRFKVSIFAKCPPKIDKIVAKCPLLQNVRSKSKKSLQNVHRLTTYIIHDHYINTVNGQYLFI